MYLGVGLYVRNSAQAVELYKAAFGLELGYHVLNDDGSYFHSELMKDGNEICSVVEANKPNSGGNPVQLGFTFQTKEELERAYELLKDGGTVDLEICELPWSPCAACVTDRFGVNWFLSLPQHRPSEDFKPSDCG
ncbi:MAG: VOC family protein [Ruminococcus sp.]|nr:VOC family protein [Ruminococcus sp.]